MTILDKDIQTYTAFKEFAQDGLYRCHPNDEARFKAIIDGYEQIILSLEKLKELGL